MISYESMDRKKLEEKLREQGLQDQELFSDDEMLKLASLSVAVHDLGKYHCGAWDDYNRLFQTMERQMDIADELKHDAVKRYVTRLLGL